MAIEFQPSVSQALKEKFLNQRAFVIWFTGLPCSGKTTLALALEKELFSRGHLCKILDGDNVRTGINSNLGFSPEDRSENIRRIAEVSKLFLETGVITINAFVSPQEELRTLAKQIIGKKRFFEIYLNPTLEVCEQRDVKGMYRLAREGKIPNFTGIQAPFEIPQHADLELDTSKTSIEESVTFIMEKIKPRLA